MRFSKENLNFGRDQRKPNHLIRERRKGRGGRKDITILAKNKETKKEPEVDKGQILESGRKGRREGRNNRK